MVCTPEVVCTTIGNTEEMKIRNTGDTSPTPNHRIAIGIQAIGAGLAQPLAFLIETPSDQLCGERLQVPLDQREDGIDEPDLFDPKSIHQVLVFIHDLDGVAPTVHLPTGVNQRAIIASIGATPRTRNGEHGFGKVGEGKQPIPVVRKQVPCGIRQRVEVLVDGAGLVGHHPVV